MRRRDKLRMNCLDGGLGEPPIYGNGPSYEVLKILTHLVVFGNKNLSLNCMHFFDNHSEVSTLRYGPVPTKAIFL